MSQIAFASSAAPPATVGDVPLKTVMLRLVGEVCLVTAGLASIGQERR